MDTPQPSKTILIVDDDPYILDMTVMFLRKKGFKIISTTDPEKAYALAEENHPDMIISDIAMPGLDGFTLLQGLRGNRVTQNIPLVLLTASDKVDDVEQGFASGAQVYLLKPIDWESAWPKLAPLLA